MKIKELIDELEGFDGENEILFDIKTRKGNRKEILLEGIGFYITRDECGKDKIKTHICFERAKKDGITSISTRID